MIEVTDHRPEEGPHGICTAAGLRWAAPSPATLASFHQNRPPRNKGLRYPPDPPTVEEIIAVMRAAGDGPDGLRLRTVIVVLWRAGLRIGEPLALAESDFDRTRGAVVVRQGLCRIRHGPCYAVAVVMPRRRRR